MREVGVIGVETFAVNDLLGNCWLGLHISDVGGMVRSQPA